MKAIKIALLLVSIIAASGTSQACPKAWLPDVASMQRAYLAIECPKLIPASQKSIFDPELPSAVSTMLNEDQKNFLFLSRLDKSNPMATDLGLNPLQWQALADELNGFALHHYLPRWEYVGLLVKSLKKPNAMRDAILTALFSCSTFVDASDASQLGEELKKDFIHEPKGFLVVLFRAEKTFKKSAYPKDFLDEAKGVDRNFPLIYGVFNLLAAHFSDTPFDQDFQDKIDVAQKSLKGKDANYFFTLMKELQHKD